jgi:glycosyltransferase involved in cell wall biosynthesis
VHIKIKNISGNSGIVIGIDASRNRSGGAIAYLIGILSEFEPQKFCIREVHVWSYKKLLDLIPNKPWLIKHNSNKVDRSLPMQLLWQATKLAHEVTLVGCDILYTTDASTFCRFRPMVVFSQDMLSYEPNVMRTLGWGKARLRVLSILYLQNMAFRRADGVIFLTQHTGKLIQESCGILPRVAFIPHGVGSDFRTINPIHPWPRKGERVIQCLYVSPIWEFKNQWVVVRGIKMLRNRGYNINLTLVGSGSGKALRKLKRQISFSDPRNEFIKLKGNIPHGEIPKYLANADLFVFASSCENMPITLLEAMAVGLPIASSDRGPMPEILKNGGIYFNPDDYKSIAKSIEKIITEPSLRLSIMKRAKNLANYYLWSRCAQDTWTYIMETYFYVNNMGGKK